MEHELFPAVADIDWIRQWSSRPQIALNPRQDRIIGESFESFVAPVSRVEYAFSGRIGSVDFIGFDPRPTGIHDVKPFLNRRGWSIGTGLVSLFLSILAAVAFSSKGAYFAGAPMLGLVSACAMFTVGAVLTTLTWRRRVVPTGQPNPPLRGDSVGPALALAAFATGVLVLIIVRPSATSALEQVAAGDLQGAREQLEALELAGEKKENTKSLKVELALCESLRLTNLEALKLLRKTSIETGPDSRLNKNMTQLRFMLAEEAIAADAMPQAARFIDELKTSSADPGIALKLEGKIVSRGIEIATKQLADGRPTEALATIAALPEANDRTQPVVFWAHITIEKLCENNNFECRLAAIRETIKVDPTDQARTRLVETIEKAVAPNRALDAKPLPKGGELEILDRSLDEWKKVRTIIGEEPTILNGLAAATVTVHQTPPWQEPAS